MSLPDALLFSSATRLLPSLRAREISATELVDAHLARIAAVNPRLSGRTSEGLPIGVQVVGRRFAEGQALAAAAVIERALEGYQRPPDA